MADTRFGEQDQQLDWDNLSGPVPMDLIDPEFPAHPPEKNPGAASRILPREESEALARETGFDQAGETPGNETVAMSAEEAAHRSHDDASPPASGPYIDPRATLVGAPPFGPEAVQDDFARIRAEMEAEAEAERIRKAETEQEEAAQRARLEQWMANARARLLKADADLTGPVGRVRLRKEASPSLYRLAEMQKTMHFDGDATQPDGTMQAPVQAPPDPMATISVPAEQFLSGGVTLFPPGRQAQMTPAPTPQAAQAPAAEAPAVEPPVAKAPWPDPIAIHPVHPEAKAAPVFRDPPYESGPIPLVPPALGEGGDYRPMSREEALTRKVAKLRSAAEAGENTLALAPAPGEDGEGRALNFAIAAVVLIGILVIGLGLFAATQAGLFDGLENRIPFLKPRMAALIQPAAAVPEKATPSAIPPAVPAGKPAATAAPVPARPSEPASAPAPRNSAVTPRPARAVPAAGKARKAPAPAPAAEADDGIPSYARPPAKTGNLGEIILRNSVEAATHIDKDNLLELYNRYALGFPGLSGEVTIGLTVDPGGRILEGSVISSSTGVDAFDQELLRKVLEWRLRSFPESRPKSITVPFLFPMQGH
jgi:TonB family protein